MKQIDGHYQIKRELGQGLSGEVFLVEKDGKELALKLLKSGIGPLGAEEATALFKAEFSLLKQLSHPHIAKILDFGQDPETGRHYFTCEFIPGADLFKATRQASWETKQTLFLQALRALAYLHSRHITHYDLKPENLLVHGESGELKVIDFGLAGFRPRGQMAGTPAYMAPEIVLGNRPDPRADLYSLGVSFYESFLGDNPFRGSNLSETLRRQERHVPKDLSELQPEIPPAISQVIAGLLKKNPSERISTASAALRIFSQLSEEPIETETEATLLSYLPNESQVIGRKAELEKFEELLQGLLKSQGGAAPASLVVIHGPKGVGKSRLLQEFQMRAQLAGLRTLRPHGDRWPESEGMACILFEDLRSEQIKKLGLKIVSPNFSGLVVATTHEALPAMDNLIAMELQPFTAHELRDYLSALTNFPDPPQALVDELLKRSRGFPQFLTELLQELIRKGELIDSHGRWSAETLEDLGLDFSQADPSEAYQDMLAAEVEQLDRPAQRLLRWMSLHPEAIPADLLEAVASQEDLSYWLLELIQADLIQRVEGRQAFQIRNPVLQEWLKNSIEIPDRRNMHGRWAQVLKERGETETHWLYHQGRAGTDSEALMALRELGRKLDTQGDYLGALETYRLGLKFPKLDLDNFVTLTVKVADDLLALGKAEEATQTLDQLFQDCQELPKDPKNHSAKVKTLQKLGTAYLKLRRLSSAEQAFHRAIEEESESGTKEEPWRQLVLKNYLARTYQHEGNLPEAKQIFSETRQEWQQVLNPEDQRLVINNELGEVLLRMGHLEAAQEILREDLKFYQDLGDPALQCKARYNLAETYFAQKNWEKAQYYYEQCVDLAKSHQLHEILLRAYNGLGNLHHYQSHPTQSLKFYERGLAIAQRLDDFSSLASLEINIGMILNKQKKTDSALPHLISATHLLERLGLKGIQEKYLMTMAAIELADVYRQQQQWTPCETQMQVARDLIHKNDNLDSFRFPLRILQAKVHHDRGEPSRAQEVLGELKGESLSTEQSEQIKEVEAYMHQSQGKVAAPSGTPLPGAPDGSEASTMIFGGAPSTDYARLLELTQYINAEPDLSFVLRNVLRFALELSEAERGLILLMDDTGRLEVKASINTEVNANLSDISTRVAQQVLESGEAVETDDASNDDRFNEYQSVMILKLRSILCLPIKFRNKTVGVLYLDNRYRPSAFQAARFPILKAFCDQAGIAIENARLLEHYQNTQNKLEDQLEAARSEAEHYHELLGETTGKILPTKYSYDNIVARSKPMHEVFKLLDKITDTNISVFINGETGTGKELIAKALHYNNPSRQDKRFVAINCGGIPPTLIESELFGYKAGAFTGATRDKKGIFAEADGGTLFMDEVADLDLNMQVKLLRALEEGEVTPVGDTKPIHFDVRVVSASHKNLEDMVADGDFREDLFYRLCQIRLVLPPLRERKEDLELLIKFFIERYAKENQLKSSPKVASGLMKKLMDYDWPGNIRELENTIRVCCALFDGKELKAEHLPANFGERKVASVRNSTSPQAEAKAEAQAKAKGYPIDDFNSYQAGTPWNRYEQLIFAKAYAQADYKPVQAAKDIGVSTATFYKRIKDFNLNNKSNPLFKDDFIIASGKSLREYLEDVVWAAYQAAEEKSYTAIEWLDVSQGHFYNVLKSAKKRLKQ